MIECHPDGQGQEGGLRPGPVSIHPPTPPPLLGPAGGELTESGQVGGRQQAFAQ